MKTSPPSHGAWRRFAEGFRLIYRNDHELLERELPVTTRCSLLPAASGVRRLLILP